MTSPAGRGVYRRQAEVLAELRRHSPASLRHVDTIRVTSPTGAVTYEAWEARQLEPDAQAAAETVALAAVAAARARSKKDCLPCRVAPGLYIGGAGAARNLKALRKRGITHVVNAAPAVPCHFKDNPEGAFTYLQLPLFDDPDADLAPHIAASNAFIAAARAHGSGVLVHCYAGQSRSAALVIAHLMASRGLILADAWAATRAARPCARPNAGFMRQLALYGKGLACGTPAGAPLAGPAAALEEAGVELGALVLTQ